MPASSSKKTITICEQEGSKCPVLHPGDLNAELFQKFEITCRNYVTNKDIAEEKQAAKVMTALKDPCWEEWVKVHYDKLETLPLKTFLTKFKDNFMPANWEMDVCIELNVMNQVDHQSFHDFSITVQNKNGLLKNTESHLDTACLHTQIKVGMDPVLNKCSFQSDKTFHLIKDFQPWIEAVKELDDTLQMDCAKCHTEMEAAQRASHQRTQDEHLLAEPSLKCHKPYIFHMKNNNKCDFPKGSRYKPVTQAVFDVTCYKHGSKKKWPVATIASTSSSASDVDSYPVAAIMGFASNPTRYTAINTSDVLSKGDEEDKLDSDVCACNTLIESIDNPVITPPKANNTHAPLTVPHLFWQASCSPINNRLLTFDCLLNVGSHLVIIHEDIVD